MISCSIVIMHLHYLHCYSNKKFITRCCFWFIIFLSKYWVHCIIIYLLCVLYSLRWWLFLCFVSTCKTFLLYSWPTVRRWNLIWRSKALEDLAKMVLEELDPNLNYFLLLDHDYPLHDSILGLFVGLLSSILWSCFRSSSRI